VTPGGAVTTLAGLAGSSGSADGPGSAARFYWPWGVAVDSAGNVYVADYRNHTIREVAPGGVVTTLAGRAPYYGSVDGTGGAARFYFPEGVAVDSTGNVYVADTWNHTIRAVMPGGVVTTLAGLAGSSGSADGTASAAQFNGPSGVAVDSAGNVYVADYWNNTIRKVTPGVVVTTLAGLAGSSGSTDGAASAAGFFQPEGVAVDSAGNVYVADTDNDTIRKVTPGGVATTLAGLAGSSGSADGTGSAARFNTPSGVAVDSAGNVYVADSGNSTLRKVTPDGVVTTLAGRAGKRGSADGTGSAARFSRPFGVAVDSVGNVYVADTSNNTLRKVTPGGAVTTLAGLAGSSGSADGTGSAARFYWPWGVAVDSAGNVYVADYWNQTIREVTPAGVVTTLAGRAGYYGRADGPGGAARFYFPEGVAVDSAGNVYVADTWNHTIREVTPGGVVTTLAGRAGSSGSGDGTGSAAQFNAPSGVAVDSAGNVYVADYWNSTIRKVTPGGVVTTLAGVAGSPGSADGAGSAAQFNGPSGVAVDSAGNVYVADYWNSTIRKVTPGGVVTTLAGLAGSSGSTDGAGSAARFYGPSGVAADGAGNVYVADSYNCTIREVTPGGVVTTLAGLAGKWGSADGPGSAARFNGPSGVAVDSAGNVYVADYGNFTIRKVTPGGVVTTLAGLAGSSGTADGPGSAGRFNWPSGVAVDGAGNAYVADTLNCTIRKVTPGGVVTTLAGVAGWGWSGDGTGSAASFWHPRGVAADSAGNVYVADTGNSTIRKVTPGGVVTTLAGLPLNVGSADGTGRAARFNGPSGVAVDSAGIAYVADTGNNTIRIGGVACPDAPTIDLAVGAVGELRQLDTSPQTAVAWQWRLIREPAASAAALSAANVRNPTFTPDVADLYIFRLSATNAAGAVCIRRLAFTAAPPPSILLNDGNLGVRSNHFGFDVSASSGQAVVVETSTDLVNWTALATNTVGASPFYFRDAAPPNSARRFYRARAQ
jgi:sugar lactone lactonase YvrE